MGRKEATTHEGFFVPDKQHCQVLQTLLFFESRLWEFVLYSSDMKLVDVTHDESSPHFSPSPENVPKPSTEVSSSSPVDGQEPQQNNEMWPVAVKEKNKYEWLPLHFVCSKNAPLDIIQLLEEKWPQLIHAVNNFRDTPSACAKKYAADTRTVSLLEDA